MDTFSKENSSTLPNNLSPPPLNQPHSTPPSSLTPSEKPTSLTPAPPSNHPTSTLLTHTTTHLAHLTRILSTTPGLDTTLLTLTYTLHLLHSRLLALSTRRLASTAQSLVSKLSAEASALETDRSGETLVTRMAQAPRTRLARTVRSLRALTALLDDARLFLRLWGVLGLWAWAAEMQSHAPADGVLRAVAYLQVGANVVYQVLENGAYLASHDVLRWPERRVNQWYLWSSRFWMGHVGLEGVRLGREWLLRKRVAERRGGRAEEVEVKMERVRVEARWWREVVVNAAYAPLTVHWSVDGGVMGEGVVGGLGMVAGWVGMAELWRRTA